MGKSKKQREAELARLTSPQMEALQQQLFAESKQALIDKPARDAREASEAAEKAKLEEEMREVERVRKEKEEKEFLELKEANERRAEMDRLSNERYKAKIAAEAKKIRTLSEEKEKEWRRLEREAIEAQKAKVEKYREEKAAKEQAELAAQRAEDEEAARLSEAARRAALTEAERALEDKEAAELSASIDNDPLFGGGDPDEELALPPTEQYERQGEASSDESNDDMNSLFGEDSGDETGLSSPPECNDGNKNAQVDDHQRATASPSSIKPRIPNLSSLEATAVDAEEDIEALLLADLEAELAMDHLATAPAAVRLSVNAVDNETTLKQANTVSPAEIEYSQTPTLLGAEYLMDDSCHRQVEVTNLEHTASSQDALATASGSASASAVSPFPGVALLPATAAPASQPQLPAMPPRTPSKASINILAKNQTFELPDGTRLNGSEILTYTPEQKAAFNARFKVIQIKLTPDGQFAVYGSAYKNPAQEAGSIPNKPQLSQAVQVPQQHSPDRSHISPVQWSQMSQPYQPAIHYSTMPQSSYIPPLVYDSQAPSNITAAQFHANQQEIQANRAAYEQRRQQYNMQAQSTQVRQQIPLVDLTEDSQPRVSQPSEPFGYPSEFGHYMTSRHAGHAQYLMAPSSQCAPHPMIQNMMQPGLQPYMSGYQPRPQTLGTPIGRSMQPQAYQIQSTAPQPQGAPMQNNRGSNSGFQIHKNPLENLWQHPTNQFPTGTPQIHNAATSVNAQGRKRAADSMDPTIPVSSNKKQRVEGGPRFNGAAQNIMSNSTTRPGVAIQSMSQQQPMLSYAQEQQSRAGPPPTPQMALPPMSQQQLMLSYAQEQQRRAGAPIHQMALTPMYFDAYMAAASQNPQRF